MTVREKMSRYLQDKGLWPNEAESILDEAEKAESDGLEAMRGNWHKVADGEGGYPMSFFAVVAMALDSLVVEWIDANKPQHFARAMFID